MMNMNIIPIHLFVGLLICFISISAQVNYVSTLAGSGTATYADGTGTSASFKRPHHFTIDQSGVNLYLADEGNCRIRRIVIATGVVTTLAGSGSIAYADGIGTAASFNQPIGITIDPSGVNLYVADSYNHRIRQIVISTKTVTTLAGSGSAAYADGIGVAASFNIPCGITIDPSGVNLYVADSYNHRIRQIVISTKTVTTLAGSGSAAYADGIGVAASFNGPRGITIDQSGVNLYVTEEVNNRIRQIVISTKTVTTLAGSGSAAYADGIGVAASFNVPEQITIDPSGVKLHMVDRANNRIRQIVISTKTVTTLAGSGSAAYADGIGVAASFNQPVGITIDPSGVNLYVADQGNHRIRMISNSPSFNPTTIPSIKPTISPTINPSINPTFMPTIRPTIAPSSFSSNQCLAGTCAINSTCVQCSPGYYSSLNGYLKCLPCSVGTFALSAGSITCDLCPTGQTSLPGASVCSSCPAGSYNSMFDSRCVVCSPGFYSSSAGSTACGGCNGGQWSSVGSSTCNQCLAGSYSLNGQNTCSFCPAGLFSSSGSSTCSSCPAGTYSPPGASVCTSCPAGSYNSMFDSRCVLCPPGFYSSAAGSTACGGCNGGQWSSVGSSTCNQCLAGSYSLNGQNMCSFCPAGLFSSSGSSTCLSCPVGTYSPPGASVCTSCPAGTYSFQCIGTCAYCPSGLFSGSGASICSPCSHGTTSIGGSSSCVKISGNASSCFG